MSRGDVNIGALVASLYTMKQFARVSDAVGVVRAMCDLRGTCLPDAYIDGLEQELLQMIGQPFPDKMQVHVYLAFHGADERASYMKIGVAKNVHSRMAQFSTGNPLPRLWTYSAPFMGRSKALQVERLLLDHMGRDRVKGEWIKVAGLTEQAAGLVAESLAEFAAAETSLPVSFTRHGG